MQLAAALIVKRLIDQEPNPELIAGDERSRSGKPLTEMSVAPFGS